MPNYGGWSERDGRSGQSGQGRERDMPRGQSHEYERRSFETDEPRYGRERTMQRGRGQQEFGGERYDYGRRDDTRFDNDDEGRRVPINETERLIASDKVEGTAVYDRQGNRLGTIENFMVGKQSGKVEYAALSFGGFMGMGGRHYPIPWNQLDYDERRGGYVVDMSERDLERAPSHRAGETPQYEGRYGAAVQDYYARSSW